MYGFICFFICLCAIIAGIGTGLLWVSLGRYMTQCANDTNKGMFNAVFWVFMMTCQVVGNILGATIIEKIKQSTFFIGFTILALIAAAWMAGLPTPKNHPPGTKAMPVEDEAKPLSPKKEIELVAISAEDPEPAG